MSEGNGAAGASAFTGAVNLAEGFSQYSAYSAVGKAAQNQAEANARLIDKQAAEEIRLGNKQAAEYKKKGKLTQASQKTAMAAQGIEVSSGSALDILLETAEITETDVQTIKNNAWRSAYGMKSQAIETRAQGLFDRASAQAQANSSLITSGLKAAGNFNSAFGGPKSKPDSKLSAGTSAGASYRRSGK